MEPEMHRRLEAVSLVFPLRANRYVLDHLIDWDRVPDDPVFRLVFPQPEMLPEHMLSELCDALSRQTGRAELDRLVRRLQLALNPQPAGQTTLNVPLHDLEGQLYSTPPSYPLALSPLIAEQTDDN